MDYISKREKERDWELLDKLSRLYSNNSVGQDALPPYRWNASG